MYTIGEFSNIGKVSTKMLRHYDKIGLLKPNYVNPDNGYRFYTKDQVQIILLINKLKRYQFSLQEISNLIHNSNDNRTQLIKLLNEKVKNINVQIALYKFLLQDIEDEIKRLKNGGDIMPSKRNFEIKIDEQKVISVVSIRKTINMEEIGSVIGKAFQTIHENGLEPAAQVMTKYYDENFDPESADIEICIPVNKTIQNLTKDFGGFTYVHTTYVGPYSEIGEAYAYLTDWIKDNDYEIIQPPFEKYIKGAESGCSPKEFITEVCFPIRKK